ncbi:MAG: hypothetical protein HY938_05745 [Nitrosomonadales bacterium]|nr:hypothetical protein [Nitrosomonadales bacterium]
MKKHEWRILALRFIYPVILTIGLAACHTEMSPLISGVLEYPSQNGGFNKKELSSDQLQKFSIWLMKHNDGWNGCYATYPSGFRISIFLQHANGESGHINFLSHENMRHTLEAKYFDGGNQSKQTCALLTVTEQEINDLYVLLSVENKP